VRLKCWYAIFVIFMVTGCGTTSSYRRDEDIQANLPRAQGLGAFAPSCVFLCFPTVTFSHGDDNIDPNTTAALRGNMRVESAKTSSAMKSAKKSPPPKGNTP